MISKLQLLSSVGGFWRSWTNTGDSIEDSNWETLGTGKISPMMNRKISVINVTARLDVATQARARLSAEFPESQKVQSSGSSPGGRTST